MKSGFLSAKLHAETSAKATVSDSCNSSAMSAALSNARVWSVIRDAQKLPAEQVRQPFLPIGNCPPATSREICVSLGCVDDSDYVHRTLRGHPVAQCPDRVQATDDKAEELITASISGSHRCWIAREGWSERGHERTDPALDVRVDLDEDGEQLSRISLLLHLGHPRTLAPLLRGSVPQHHSVLNLGQEPHLGAKDEIHGLHSDTRRLGDHLYRGRLIATG